MQKALSSVLGGKNGNKNPELFLSGKLFGCDVRYFLRKEGLVVFFFSIYPENTPDWFHSGVFHCLTQIKVPNRPI